MFLEVLVEEPSARALVTALLPRIVPETDFQVHVFRGKQDLMRKLEQRLAGYAEWLSGDYGIVVLVDEDRQDCHELKRRMENAALSVGLATSSSSGGQPFQVLNRIAMEEIEAWYLGDLNAVRLAYPRVPASLDKREGFRDPDAVPGGTAERFGKVLRDAGYHRGGLAKVKAARDIAGHLEPERNRSRSFQVFVSGIRRLAEQPG